MRTCLSEAQRMQQAGSISNPSDLDEYVKKCMDANGYRLNAMHSGCGHGDPYRDEACYVQK